jgi:predicted nucleic acid-binding protein
LSFIDTNVLVYASAVGSPFHAQARAALGRLSGNGQVAISRQVLREYLAVMTRPQAWSTPLTVSAAMADTRFFCSRFAILEDGTELLTFNAADFRRFQNLIAVAAP